MSMNITIEHQGKTYHGTVMRIASTMLGIEDHGIFTAQLNCEGSGFGVSLGGYGLDAWSADSLARVGHAFGVDHIKAILRTAGVEQWEKLVGIHVVVLSQSEWGDAPCGLSNIDGSRVLIFAEHYSEVMERLSEK